MTTTTRQQMILGLEQGCQCHLGRLKKPGICGKNEQGCQCVALATLTQLQPCGSRPRLAGGVGPSLAELAKETQSQHPHTNLSVPLRSPRETLTVATSKTADTRTHETRNTALDTRPSC